MKKTILTTALLLFVAVCVAVMLFKDNRGLSIEATETMAPATVSQTGLVAYYFHGTARCVTCRKIESYAQQALTEAFPNEIEEGVLTWRPINVEEPENQHFIEDFALSTKSVVLVRYQEGTQSEWKNLDQIWTLTGDETAFKSYIQTETQAYLEAL